MLLCRLAVTVLSSLALASSSASNRYMSLHSEHKEKILAASCGALEDHTVFSGHDVGGDPSNGTKVDSLAECCDLCNAVAECRFLTYNAPTCYLKTSDSGRKNTGPHGKQISAAMMPPTH